MTDYRHNRPVWLQCGGKAQFASPQIAARVARRQNGAKKRRKRRIRKLNSYHCPHCGFFHIGGTGKLI